MQNAVPSVKRTICISLGQGAQPPPASRQRSSGPHSASEVHMGSGDPPSAPPSWPPPIPPAPASPPPPRPPSAPSSPASSSGHGVTGPSPPLPPADASEPPEASGDVSGCDELPPTPDR